MQSVIHESTSPERDQQILEAIAKGVEKKDVAEQFGLAVGTIRKIVRREKNAKLYALSLTDGAQTVPVGQVKTSRGFIHACQCAKRKYIGTFARLELPQWKFIAGNESVALNSAELA